MKIFIVILLNLFIFKCYCLNSSCLPCKSINYHSCYQCYNKFPIDYIYIEKISIQCSNLTQKSLVFHDQQRFYSTIKDFSIKFCIMKTFYMDQFTLWNYLESLSITYGHLTRLSPVIFNRSLSFSPILYSIKTLNFSHNSIRLIDTNFSYYFPSLEKLDLSYNQLILLRQKTFNNLNHLKELYLNNNQLKQILSTNFPRQSLQLINLSHNRWHCSCTNVLILSISRPVPTCHSPSQYKSLDTDDIARQCFLRSKAIILITTTTVNQNLTCALSSTIYTWKSKLNKTIQLQSAWHIEQHRPISIEYLHTLSQKLDKYLICFLLNSSQIESIYTIIPLMKNFSHSNPTINFSMNNYKRTTVEPSEKLPNIFLWLLNTGRNILPKFIRTSDKQVLVVWLILLIIVFIILSFLLYLTYRQRKYNESYEINSIDAPSLIHLKCTCKAHKCLCQYNGRTNSTLCLTKDNQLSKSVILSNMETNETIVQPLLIEPMELRYAKIKRISSAKDIEQNYLAGQFRTTVTVKTNT